MTDEGTARTSRFSQRFQMVPRNPDDAAHAGDVCPEQEEKHENHHKLTKKTQRDTNVDNEYCRIKRNNIPSSKHPLRLNSRMNYSPDQNQNEIQPADNLRGISTYFLRRRTHLPHGTQTPQWP